MKFTYMSRVLVLAACLFGMGANAQDEGLTSSVEGLQEMREHYGIAPGYLNLPATEDVRVAIVGSGTQGLENLINGQPSDRRYLPLTTEVVWQYPGLTVDLGDSKDSMIRRMGQIVWGMTGSVKGPTIKVFSAIDLAQTAKAIERLSSFRPHVVLAWKNYQTFGRQDGSGGIARLIDTAVAGGSIWVHAAGDFRQKTHNSPVVVSKNNRLYFERSGADYLRFKVNSAATDVSITVALSRPESQGAARQLNICLYPPEQRETLTKPKLCKTLRSAEGDPQAPETEDSLSFETLKTVLWPTDRPYLIAVERIEGDFDAARDNIRVTVTTSKTPIFDGEALRILDAVEFVDADDERSLGNPSDSRRATVVGAATPSSSVGPTGDGRRKPDAVLDSTDVFFSDNHAVRGSVAAAAQFAGMVVLMKAKEAGFQGKHLATVIKENGQKGNPATLVPGVIGTHAADGWQFGMDKLKLEDGLKRALIATVEGTAFASMRRQKSESEPLMLALCRDPIDLPGFALVRDKLRKENQPYRLYVRTKEGRVESFHTTQYIPNKSAYEPWQYKDQGAAKDYVELVQLPLSGIIWNLAKVGKSQTFTMPSEDRLHQIVVQSP
jgi:hypothetical protein